MSTPTNPRPPETSASASDKHSPAQEIVQLVTESGTELLHSPEAEPSLGTASEMDPVLIVPSPGGEYPLPSEGLDSLQEEIEDAVKRKHAKWREAKSKGNRFVTVAEEADVQRVLRQVESAERGLAPAPVERQPVQTLEEFLQRTFAPKEHVIERLLYRRDIVALAGRRRHGKTTIISNLVLALILGLPNFLGYPIPNPVRVLVFYLEDDAGELQIRFKRMTGDRLSEESRERLALYVREDFYRANIPIDAANPQFQKFVIDSCAAHNPDVVIFDNLAQLIGADHNNSKLIHKLIQFIWQITNDFNAAAIIAAHPRKRDKHSDAPVNLRDDSEGFFEEVMGSSHFVNSCGSLWGIERDLSSDRTVFLGGAQRYTGQQTIMTLEKDDDDWLRCVNDLEVNLRLVLNTPARRRAWELLPDSPFSYTEAERIVKPAMKSSSTFHGWFQHCQRLGIVVRNGDTYNKAAGTKCGIVEVSS